MDVRFQIRRPLDSQMWTRLALALLLGFCLLDAAADSVRVPQAQIEETNARYASFGLKLPKGGIILSAPYDPPYSNRSFIVPKEWIESGSPWFGGTPPVTVSAADVRADLPTLRVIMENAYAGWDTALARGWDWGRWFADWDAALHRDGDEQLTAAVALAPWKELQAFQPDDHSQPLLSGFGSHSVSAELTSRPPSLCGSMRTTLGNDVTLPKDDAGKQPHEVLRWDGATLSPTWYVAFPNLFGDAVSITCGSQVIPLTMTAQPKQTGIEEAYRDLGDGISYIRAPASFSYENDDKFKTMLGALRGLENRRVVLLDLRGNTGGAAPDRLLSKWFSEAQIVDARFMGSRHGTQSCYATGIGFNLGQILSASLKAPLSADSKELLQAQLDAIGDESPDQCTVKQVAVSGKHDLLTHHFTARRSDVRHTRVIAVVDDHCGSDCEGLAMTLSVLPDTVIAGTSTYGAIGFVLPGFFVLPHSRIPFEIATARDDNYGDGRSESDYGISVDVLLPTPESQTIESLRALAVALSG